MFDDHGKWTSWAMIHDALDALPDASEQAQQAGDGAEER
jgi:hypothetical protein